MATVKSVLAWLKETGSKETESELLSRYGIPNTDAYGVAMGKLKEFEGQLGKDRQLAGELWQSGCYEARTIAVLIDEPTKVTSKQMDQWVGDFDSWAICKPLASICLIAVGLPGKRYPSG